jgi:hypothetical protein
MKNNLEQLLARQAELQAIREDLFAKQKPINHALVENHGELEKIAKQIDKLKFKNMGDAVDWKLLLEPGEGSQVRYDRRQQEISKIGLHCMGMWTTTNQASIAVKLTHGDKASFDRTLAAIKTIAPYIIPHDDGLLWFQIFEHTLSAGGSFYLKCTPDLKCAHIGSTYRSILRTRTLSDALRYIQENLWYDGRKFTTRGDE